MRITTVYPTTVNGYRLLAKEVLLEDTTGSQREVGMWIHDESGKTYYGVRNPLTNLLELFPTWIDADIHMEHLANLDFDVKEVF